MKALSLWQPWASALVLGAKRIETRSWSTNYRGRFLIHAAKKITDDLRTVNSSWTWKAILKPIGDEPLKLLPLGHILGYADLIDCVPTANLKIGTVFTKYYWRDAHGFLLNNRANKEPMDLDTWTENNVGDYAIGRFAWFLDNIVEFENPIPLNGMQGLFEVDWNRHESTRERLCKRTTWTEVPS